MATAVLIMGESGSGKSASLRNFAPNEISVFNITSKPLPFKQGKTKIPKIDNATYADIANALAKPNKRAYVIDDAGYLLSFEMFKRANETGYTKFTEMAKNFFDMLDFINTKLPSDIIVYITMHTEDDSEMHKTKAKTIGKMLDEKLTIEGCFDVVLMTERNQDGWWFRTHSTGNDPVKTPIEMFDDDLIPNDLAIVDAKVREYYGLEDKKK